MESSEGIDGRERDGLSREVDENTACVVGKAVVISRVWPLLFTTTTNASIHKVIVARLEDHFTNVGSLFLHWRRPCPYKALGSPHRFWETRLQPCLYGCLPELAWKTHLLDQRICMSKQLHGFSEYNTMGYRHRSILPHKDRWGYNLGIQCILCLLASGYSTT